jgi:hypothetical protein
MTSSSTMSTAQRADCEVVEEPALVVTGFVVVVALVLPTVTVLPLVAPVLAEGAVLPVALVPVPAAAVPPPGVLEVAMPVDCGAAETEESPPPQAAKERRTALNAALGSINRIQPVHINDVASLAAAL